MKINYPGLLIEKLPSGNKRYRVRKEGNKNIRITLPAGPEHPRFTEYYAAARSGIVLKSEVSPADQATPYSVSWLIYKYLEHFEKEVEAGQLSAKTLKKRRNIFNKIQASGWREKSLDIPTLKIIEYRDTMRATPAAADDMVKALKAMYKWAVEKKYIAVNPAAGIENIDRGKGGAKPWTVEDLKQFRSTHAPGTTAYLVLTILMFTACRIGDAAVLGRENEFTRSGVKGLGWQPEKKNSPYVEIPMVAPLLKATGMAKVKKIDGPYVLNKFGQPYSSGETLGQTFRKWCRQAGLERSAHGVRKAAGHLLALEGCTQYQIMAIHGHAQASTSEVYTKGVERWRLAVEAANRMQTSDW